MWNGWNHPPDGFLMSQISTAPSAGLAWAYSNFELSTSTHVLPLTVQLPFVRRSSKLRDGPAAMLGWRPMTSWFGFRFPLASANWLLLVSSGSPPTSKHMMSFVDAYSTLFGGL